MFGKKSVSPSATSKSMSFTITLELNTEAGGSVQTSVSFTSASVWG